MVWLHGALPLQYLTMSVSVTCFHDSWLPSEKINGLNNVGYALVLQLPILSSKLGGFFTLLLFVVQLPLKMLFDNFQTLGFHVEFSAVGCLISCVLLEVVQQECTMALVW